MKQILIVILLFISTLSYSQQKRIDPHLLNHDFNANLPKAPQQALTNDTNFNVVFYHIDVEVAIDSAYLQGSVSYIIISELNGLNSINLDLDSAFAIDSVSAPIASFGFTNNVLNLNFATSFNQGDTISFSVYYGGIPVLAGGYKGLRYETHDGNEPIIATLSTPYLAHTWWPCKDGTSDKADSTYISITVKDTIISNLQLIAVSNGLLDAVETSAGKKTYNWKHTYPCVPYYIMMAISNYDHFQQVYQDTNYSFPIDYYVFSSHKAIAQTGVANMPDAIAFFTSIFGPYPFLREKYGMTQLGYYGAIENQTNTITNNMSSSWFDISVHELAHQWFADMITCETWNHGWLNEGFASYAEALYAEHTGGYSAYQSYMTNFEFYGAGSVYMNDVSNPFNVFQPIIYNKGAYVLHMLRGVLGDSIFFKSIKTYATNSSFMYKNASTEDFQAICESISGQNLNYFFDQWIYDERYPMYSYNYEYDGNTGDIIIAIEQTQSSLAWRNTFEMPMEIKVNLNNGTDTILQIYNDTNIQTYTFALNQDVSSIQLDPNKRILGAFKLDTNVALGIIDVEDYLYTVYPNPNNGSFNISIESGNNDNIQLSIFDLSGKELYHSDAISDKSNIYNIDIPNVKSGIYILSITKNGVRYFRKISVVR